VSDEAYLLADALDRRAALDMATGLAASCSSDEAWPWQGDDSRQVWLKLADHAYRWLRCRDSLKAVALVLNPGTPYPEGTTPMGTTFDLSDTDQVVFTLSGVDAKGAAVPAPTDTWSWTLDDPDATGSVLTVSADTTSATVAAGTPDTTGTLTLNVTGANSGLVGAEAILVVASAATAISIVPGTPSAEAAPASDVPPAS
jgi:hypothetical protein